MLDAIPVASVASAARTTARASAFGGAAGRGGRPRPAAPRTRYGAKLPGLGQSHAAGRLTRAKAIDQQGSFLPAPMPPDAPARAINSVLATAVAIIRSTVGARI